MKIAIIGPGSIEIPPKGWGAVEIIIHEYQTELRKLGWEVLVTNTRDHEQIVRQVEYFQPDFVHCQYDEHIDALTRVSCPHKAITSHFGYLEQVWRFPEYLKNVHEKIVAAKDVRIFALSPSIADVYRSDGVAEYRLVVMPNGVRRDAFHVSPIPKYPDRSMYLAKVDFRKRQGRFQVWDLGIDFVGNLCPHTAVQSGFDPSRSDYLGEWSKADVYLHLTDYANLVLLSDGEAHPLVCLEALAAGLGIVVSEWATANFDLAKPFIDVVPEERIHDREYIASVIESNRVKALAMRSEISAYASEFEWSRLICRYDRIVRQMCAREVSTVLTPATKPIRLAVVTVATGKYFDLFFPDFEQTVYSTLAPGHEVGIFCFTDQMAPCAPNTRLLPTRHMGWPFDSLMRFHLIDGIADQLADFDYVLYLDSDMKVLAALEPEILKERFVAVSHPGFCHQAALATFEIDRTSAAFVPEAQRMTYVQGCFFGGRSLCFRYLVRILHHKVAHDLAAGAIPAWHDESYLNWFFSVHAFRALSPGYAYPEGSGLEAPAIVLHRKKDHRAARSMVANAIDSGAVLRGLSAAEGADFYRVLYLRAHEKVQRLESKILALQRYRFPFRRFLGKAEGLERRITQIRARRNLALPESRSSTTMLAASHNAASWVLAALFGSPGPRGP
jgi:hypothetical protein